MHSYPYVCVYVCMHVCMYACMYVCIYIRTYVRYILSACPHIRVTGHSAGGAVGAYTAMVLEVRTHRTYIYVQRNSRSYRISSQKFFTSSRDIQALQYSILSPLLFSPLLCLHRGYPYKKRSLFSMSLLSLTSTTTDITLLAPVTTTHSLLLLLPLLHSLSRSLSP